MTDSGDKYNGVIWIELPTSVREAATELGYNKKLWDNDVETNTCEKCWDDLTDPQQEAAKTLGYSREAWDEDKDKKWKILPPMITLRHDAVGIWVNDHQFLAIGPLNCEYYDTKTREWMAFPFNLPEMRMGHGAVIVRDRLFVLGGRDYSKAHSDVFSISISGNDLSAVTENWIKLGPMRNKRSDFACVSDSRYIYVFGGLSAFDAEEEFLRSAERYDTETYEWTPLTEMPDKRSHCGAGMVENMIYVVGGQNDSKNSLASTVVFDTSTQKWQPSYRVPDMKLARIGLEVVVVDQFVVVMGGSTKSNGLLSSIEVFDCQRNIWEDSPTPMRSGRHRFMSGVLKATKEIMVAGGAIIGRRRGRRGEMISFERAILPSSNQFKERGQKVIGDTERGNDELDCSIIAEALVESLTFLDLEPPFVLGILGKWGRGKSFFFNLMLDHMIRIQKKSAYDQFVRKTYVGHIYVVKFDAWTFSKGCIFSSFMYEILKTLNEVLQFEAKVKNKHLLDGTVSTIEVFRNLSKREIEYTETNEKVWDYVNDAKDAKKNGEFASDALLQAINVNYERDTDRLSEIENEIRRRSAENSVRDIFDGRLNVLGEYSLEKSLTRFRKESDNKKGIDDLMTSIKNINFLWYRVRASHIPTLAFIFTAAFIIIAILFYDIIGKGIAITTGLLSALIPIVTGKSSAEKEIGSIVETLNPETFDDFAEELEAGGVQDEELRMLIQQKVEIHDRTLVLKGLSLRDTISKKINTKEYQNNLGIVHKVQQDLQLVSDGMMNEKQQDIFVRGVPRIVLFVDDLDRCEKDDVVKVIEALQLLVKTKLFVAILAIDPRYVTTSIESHYKGILNPETPPSGMDYLEKIIQIPFRLPGVQQESIDNFVDSQICVEESQSIPNVIHNNLAGTAGSQPAAKQDKVIVDDMPDTNYVVDSTESASGPQRGKQDITLKPDASIETENVALPKDDSFLPDDTLPKHEVKFTREEADMMKQLFKVFGLSPRSIRRIINVFKLLKVIWKRGKCKVDLNTKRATLFLMLLASDESTRDVTNKIFDWMDSGRVKYHFVALDDGGENNLSKVFKKELEAWNKDFKQSFTVKRTEEGIRRTTKEGTLINFADEYLSEYKWKDYEGWNQISSNFLLARSFCFYRVMPDEDDANKD